MRQGTSENRTTRIALVEGPTVEGQPGEGDDAGFCDLDRETVRNAFHLFDTDNNGVISSDELGNLLRTLGQDPTESHINELIEVRCIWLVSKASSSTISPIVCLFV